MSRTTGVTDLRNVVLRMLIQIPDVVDLRRIPRYLLTPRTQDSHFQNRRQTVLASLQRLELEDIHMVHSIWVPDKPKQACAIGHALIINKALDEPFQPFMILEDDALIEDTVSKEDIRFLRIPRDADAVYLSASSSGADLQVPGDIHVDRGSYYTNTAYHNLVRIFNMLSTHAVLILSRRFAENWRSCCIEAATRDYHFDILVALTQQYFQVYAQKTPYFYQAAKLGGWESLTRRQLSGIELGHARDVPRPANDSIVLRLIQLSSDNEN
jgi:hypothetical protein